MKPFSIFIAMLIACAIPSPGLEFMPTILFVTTKGNDVSYQVGSKPLTRTEIYSWFKHNKVPHGLEVRTDSATTFDTIVEVLFRLDAAGIKECSVFSIRRNGKDATKLMIGLQPKQATKQFATASEASTYLPNNSSKLLVPK